MLKLYGSSTQSQTLTEDEIEIDEDVIWACADDHCQFACIDGEVNIEIGMSLFLTLVAYVD